MLIIWHTDRAGRKFKWQLKGTRTEMDALRELFGEGKPVKARNPWGPAGMPLDVKRQRKLDELAEIEAELNDMSAAV